MKKKVIEKGAGSPTHFAVDLDLFVSCRSQAMIKAMVIIRFSDEDTKRRALGWLPGRFSFKSWAGGKMLVPEAALAPLAMEGIPFISEGPATYEQILTSLRNPAAA